MLYHNSPSKLKLFKFPLYQNIKRINTERGIIGKSELIEKLPSCIIMASTMYYFIRMLLTPGFDIDKQVDLNCYIAETLAHFIPNSRTITLCALTS